MMSMMCGGCEADVTVKLVGEVTARPRGHLDHAGRRPCRHRRADVLVVRHGERGIAPLKNCTAVAPVKPVPVIVTGVLTGPLVGLKLVIVGVGEELSR